MSTTVAQIPIRCRLSIVSNPPVYPIDDNTGEAPRFWRAQDVAIQVGIFDANNDAVDLANLSALILTLRDTPNSPAVYVNKTVYAAGIVPIISYSGWSSGIAQQATFYLTAADTDLPLDGDPSAQVWMDIRGVTKNNHQLVYGAGYVTVYTSGNPPSPLPAVQIVSEWARSNTAGNATISPINQIHTEFIEILGAARTSVFAVDNYASIPGARASVIFSLPATAGINIELRNDDYTGTLLASFATDGVQPSAIAQLYYDGAAWQLGGFAWPAMQDVTIPPLSTGQPIVQPVDVAVVSLNDASNSTGDLLVIPQAPLHTEVITITGVARTSNFVIVPGATTVAGSRMTMLFKLPLTANIQLDVYGNNLSSPAIASFTTDGVQTSAAFEIYYDGVNWALAESLIPSY